ncbi:MAG: hypothetical protein HY064_01265 [Bacteroidetes bacterium]|nr:hypothetical protein [Bacteroidota bacterium]
MVARLSAVVIAISLAGLFLGFRSSGNSVRVKWNAYVMHTADGEADIHFTGEIPGGWRMYSQKMAGVDGPLGANIEFDPDPTFKIVGAPAESGDAVSFYEDDLGMDVSCLENKVQYVQHITYTENKAFAIKCMINYMLERSGEILPPDDEDFTITVMP